MPGESSSEKPKFTFGQYQKQVSLLSGISMKMLSDALSQAGIKVKLKEVDNETILLSCNVNGLDFSITVIDYDGEEVSNIEDIGSVIQCLSFFNRKKITDDLELFSVLNEWNVNEAFAKCYLTDDIIVLEMLISAAGVIDDNVNEGVRAWIEICHDFVAYLAQKEN